VKKSVGSKKSKKSKQQRKQEEWINIKIESKESSEKKCWKQEEQKSKQQRKQDERIKIKIGDKESNENKKSVGSTKRESKCSLEQGEQMQPGARGAGGANAVWRKGSRGASAV
jgi:hypothetical protein